MSDRSSKSEKNLPIFDILPVTALIVTESVSSLPRFMFLSNESMKADVSVTLLVPDNVLVVSIVISITSLTLASITAPAALDVMLFNESGNMMISARLLPKIASLFANMLIVIESENSLFPAKVLDVVSVDKKLSDGILDADNNLVVSIVASTKSEGFLFDMSDLDDESDPVNMSDGDLDP